MITQYFFLYQSVNFHSQASFCESKYLKERIVIEDSEQLRKLSQKCHMEVVLEDRLPSKLQATPFCLNEQSYLYISHLMLDTTVDQPAYHH